MIKFLGLALLLPFVLLAQTGKSCCTVDATASFAMLASDATFRAAHLEPVPFNFVAEHGKDITFKTSDGIEGRAFEVKAPKPSNVYVFMIHEWWGLNDYIKQEAEKLQGELGAVNVIALDLYDGKVATTQQEAGKYMGEAKEERIRAIIAGAFGYVGPKAKVGTIGWCFGGGWSLQSALIGGKQIGACVLYYGMPETDVEKLKTLRAPVLGIFGTKDGWITPAKVKDFEGAMKKASKKLVVKSFDADHAFANPSNPKFDKAASADAHAMALEFFKKHLVKTSGKDI
ncbi:MAG: dienelactone hydrolase family protein [Ignavibacteriales bacterium]|nr:dienelactone hydrolase family protein [Ignavibacteriales bacterium]